MDNQEVLHTLFASTGDLPLKDCSSQAKVLFSPVVVSNLKKMLSYHAPYKDLIESYIMRPVKVMSVKACLLK